MPGEEIILNKAKVRQKKPLIKEKPIITLGKKDSLNNQKRLISKLQDKKSAKKVMNTLSKRYENRKGGYTRIIKAGYRYGDNAPMAVIEFVDRDVEAKRVDKKKKEIDKSKKEDQKQVTA